jgi:putative membrane protein
MRVGVIANQIKNIMNKHVKGLALLLITASGALGACNGSGSAGSSDTTASVSQPAANPAQDGTSKQDSSGIAGPVSVSKDDQNFIYAVAESGMTEIAASQAAQRMASGARVKAFAEKMVQDHGHWGDELKTLAQARNVPLPVSISDAHGKGIADLQKKQGADFDKAYMKMMVHDHEGAVHDFQKAQGSVKDSALMRFVNDHLPLIQTHLDSAKAIEKAL